MAKTALITGITGFVGPYLAGKLLNKGYKVYGLFRRRADGNRPRGLSEMHLLKEMTLLEGDVTDFTSLLYGLDKSQPDLIFHLAAQSFVPQSFLDPIGTFRTNSAGTQNLLEAMRLKESSATLIFAGSSEEYGLQIASKKHYDWAKQKYGVIYPEPAQIPELPVDEKSLLRPMSPYAVSKIHGDFLVRNYFHAFGLKTIVSRAFNHEGRGRGAEFVTSTIVRQCIRLKFGETRKLAIGNINAFRDWSHVDDITNGYITLAQHGKAGETYVQGSMRTNSVAGYLLLTLNQLGYEIKSIESLRGKKPVKSPADVKHGTFFGLKFKMTTLDELMLNGEIEYTIEDRGLRIETNKGEVIVGFDADRFRPADVPILISSALKAKELGFKVEKSVDDIISDQVNYYLDQDKRKS